VTRSHKANDRDHVAIANGTATQVERLPRYFAKNGPLDADPSKVKKEGGGRANWYVSFDGHRFLSHFFIMSQPNPANTRL
jgi:hypothetical protein